MVIIKNDINLFFVCLGMLRPVFDWTKKDARKFDNYRAAKAFILKNKMKKCFIEELK